MKATPGVLHLKNEPRSLLTLCGEPLEECWTDAIGEIIAGGLDDSVCAKCFELGRKELEELEQADGAWRHEQAIEAGMLHGIEAYNDMIGSPQ